MSQRKLNTLRIIGGRWRRRLLDFPDVPGLRPTHDRLREVLFNWLDPYIQGACCLDLFAGSGALGFEALSRGAKYVSFVDSHSEVVRYINKNARSLDARPEEFEVLQGSCPNQDLMLSSSPYQIVFLDPPFKIADLPKIISWLDSKNYLTKDTLIYVEMERENVPATFPGWKLIKEGHTKSIIYYLLQKGGE